MIETKKIFRSEENSSIVDKKIEDMISYGWKIDSKTFDSDRNIDLYEFSRDLSVEENQKLKLIEDDYIEVQNAKTYCDLNMAYCKKCADERRFYKIPKLRFVILGFFLVLTLALLLIFKYTDILTSATFKLNGEDLKITKDFIYNLPEGKTLFGLKQITYDSLIKIISGIFFAITLVISVIALLLLENALFEKKIKFAEYMNYNTERKDYYVLKTNLDNWTREKSLEGFDPYSYGGFENKKKYGEQN